MIRFTLKTRQAIFRQQAGLDVGLRIHDTLRPCTVTAHLPSPFSITKRFRSIFGNDLRLSPGYLANSMGLRAGGRIIADYG